MSDQFPDVTRPVVARDLARLAADFHELSVLVGVRQFRNLAFARCVRMPLVDDRRHVTALTGLALTRLG